MTFPWNTPIDANDPQASEKIKAAGRAARLLIQTKVDLRCSIHGIIARALFDQAAIDSAEGEHRTQEGCIGLIRPIECR